MTIDLNADLGEGEGAGAIEHDLALLELVTSANVACGFHAGSPALMRAVCAAASGRGVRIGAQVSYPDREGFGRRDMDMAPAELSAAVLYQIGALDAFGEVAYVKPHGALYHRVFHDEHQASAVVEAVLDYGAGLALLGLPGSLLLKLAQAAGLPVIEEGFADRAYTADGRLVPRTGPGSVITDANEAARRAVELARSGRVRTLCVHGDTPDALRLARQVRAALEDAGFRLAAFA